MNTMSSPEKLEDRFLQPEGWQWQVLQRDGYALRFGYISAPQTPASGLVIILPGLSEFCEKYFEITRELLKKNYAVLVIDWRGQGLASRYLSNPHKRYSQGFDSDAEDLRAVIEACPIVKSHEDIYMLAHSMGGNIGLRFLQKYPNIFKAAAFSAPLLGLHIFKSIPNVIATMVSKILAKIAPKSYAPLGGDWTPDIREKTSESVFSGDKARNKIHNAWMLHNIDLQIGHITNQWLYDAQKSCMHLQATLPKKPIPIPCLIGLAGRDSMVDNKATWRAFKTAPYLRIIELAGARHEIMVEEEAIRSKFVTKAYSFFNKSGL